LYGSNSSTASRARSVARQVHQRLHQPALHLARVGRQPAAERTQEGLLHQVARRFALAGHAQGEAPDRAVVALEQRLEIVRSDGRGAAHAGPPDPTRWRGAARGDSVEGEIHDGPTLTLPC